MFFFPQDTLGRSQAKKMFEIILTREGTELLDWRTVPVRPEILGYKALTKMPYIEKCFVRRPENVPRGLDFDRRLYVVRQAFEQSGGIPMWCHCPAVR